MAARTFFEKLRKWIDGEEDLDEQGQPKTRSKWDDFLVAVAREIETVMQREMFTPPGGPTYIPREYVVFLNPEDDGEWQGEKREGLQRGLHYVLSERAKALAGDNEFQTRSFAIELRVDAGLERNRFRVQPVWDAETERTMVQPRKRRAAEERESPARQSRSLPTDKTAASVEAAASPPPTTTTQTGGDAQGQPTSETPPVFELVSAADTDERRTKADVDDGAATDTEEATLVRPRPRPDASEADEEATRVRPRQPAMPRFTVGVHRQLENGELTTVIDYPFYKDEITIGRGSAKSNIEVDLKLDNDMEISRTHARLRRQETGDYRVTCSGANPILLGGGRELAKDETATLKTGDKITICSYELVIR